MKNFLILLAVLATLSACKKPGDSDVTVPAPEPTPHEIEITLTRPEMPAANPGPQGHATYNLLGYGYDITGKYADTSSVRNQVVNILKMAQDFTTRVDISRSNVAEFKVIYPSTAESFSRQLSSRFVETNGFSFFRGTITSPFPQQDALSEKYFYGDYSLIIEKGAVKFIPPPLISINDYLAPGFRQDIQVLSAEDLVKKYGTHILSNIGLGARINVICQVKVADNNKNKKDAAETGFNFALGHVFGLFSGILDPIEQAKLDDVSSMKLIYTSAGGDPLKIKETRITKIPSVDIADWRQSINQKELAFIYISNDGLMPLYELITDPARKTEVRNYITTYLMARKI